MLTELEIAALADHRAQRAIAGQGGDEEAAAVYFGLRLLLESGRLVRSRRNRIRAMDVEFKEDGSPATRLEAEIESLEQRVRELTDRQADPEVYRDPRKAAEIGREKAAVEGRLEALYSEWEALAAKLR